MRFACGQFANGVDAKALELFIGLGAHAVDLAASQRPDQGLQVGLVHDGDAVGLVELAGHFGDQLVGRHADRAGQARGLKNAFLDQARQHPPTFALATGHVSKVDVDLVHAPVLHDGRDVEDDAFEGAREMPVALKVHRQQEGLRAKLGGFHQAHGRADAKLPRRIGGGGDDAAPGVALDAREKVHRDAVQPFGKSLFGPFAIRVGRLQLAQQVVFFAAAAANDHRQALELRVAQQLAGRVKGVHVEVGDAAHRLSKRGGGHPASIARVKGPEALIQAFGKVPGSKMLVLTFWMLVWPQKAMVMSNSLWMICRALVTPASPMAPKP